MGTVIGLCMGIIYREYCGDHLPHSPLSTSLPGKHVVSQMFGLSSCSSTLSCFPVLGPDKGESCTTQCTQPMRHSTLGISRASARFARCTV